MCDTGQTHPLSQVILTRSKFDASFLRYSQVGPRWGLFLIECESLLTRTLRKVMMSMKTRASTWHVYCAVREWECHRQREQEVWP